MAKSLQNSLLIIVSLFSCFSLKAQHTQFQTGDIFLAQGRGIIQWRDANGTFIRNINIGDDFENGPGTGMRHHPLTGELWVTNFNGLNSTKGVRIIHKDGTPGNTINVSAYQSNPESITFDKSGNAFLGGPNGELVKINSAGTAILDHYVLELEPFWKGPDWVEMDCSDSIIYYTNEKTKIKRYNVVTHQQLPDFADLTGSTTRLFAFRLLPDSTILVVSSDSRVNAINIVFKVKSTGAIIKTYSAPNFCGFFAIAGTEDGKSFLVGGQAYLGPIYNFDITSGNIQNYFESGTPSNNVNITGFAVYGDALNNCKKSASVNNAINCPGIYPNPNKGDFTLQTALNGKVNIRVFNELGQYVFNKELNLSGINNKIPFKMENLASGVYLVQIFNNNGICSQKTIINH